MTLTLNEVEAVAAELREALAGTVLTAIAQPSDFDLLLTFKGPEGERRVRVCIRPRVSRIHLTSRGVPPGSDRTPFCGATAEILGAAVDDVRTLYHDRVLVIRLHTGEWRRNLLFECSGHHPNLFVTDGSGLIRCVLAASHSQLRELRPGKAYQRPLPHPSDGIDAMRFVAPTTSVSEQIEVLYGQAEGRENRKEEAARLRTLLRSALEASERAERALLDDLKRSKRAGGWADALMAASKDGRIVRGTPLVPIKVDGREEQVRLDPSLEPAEDLARQAARARRVAEARSGTEARLRDAREVSGVLRSAITGLGKPTDESVEAAGALVRRMRLEPRPDPRERRPRPAPRRDPSPPKPAAPPTSPGGTVLTGRRKKIVF